MGELLVQLRLLQHDVQAAPPLRDSGNDLIAVRYKTFKTIQIKTTVNKRFSIEYKKLPDIYDFLALVYLDGEASNIRLDASNIFLIPKDVVDARKFPRRVDKLRKSAFLLSREYIDELFPERHFQHYGSVFDISTAQT